jgi:hypothetical protein
MIHDRLIINAEFRRDWKEVIVACFEILYLHLHGGPEVNHEEIHQDSQSNLGIPKYKAGILTVTV